MKIILLFPLLLLSMLPLSLYADTQATVIIDTTITTAPVNRLILGNNIIGYNAKFKDQGQYGNMGAGVWDPKQNAPVSDYVKLARNAGVSILRWPGGNHSRTMDWKRAIGPVSERPGQKFGLPEFLRFCAEVDAQPLIVVANQVGTHADAADLVEYLNAPQNAKNPNGGVDWAARRAADGHPEPWNVTWFVLGNETFYTNVPVEEYADKYLEYQAAMKSVSPEIKLGAVLEDSENVYDGWTHTLVQQLRKNIDFGDFHPYFPKISKRNAKHFSQHEVALAAVSADADFIYRLRQYRSLGDFPLVATEYNGLFVQNEPVPYRQTLVNAIHNADFVRIMLQPEFNIAAANFWHFSNGYWGMIRGYPQKKQPLVKQANYYVYELYNRYLGDELLPITITSPTFEFSGCCSVSPRVGAVSQGKITPIPSSELPQSWNRRPFMDGSQSQDDGTLTVDFDKHKDMNYHHAKKIIPVEPNTLYKISVEIKIQNIKDGKVGIEVQDARGWKKTFSRSQNVDATGNTDWTWITTEYRTLPDAKEIMILARRYKGHGAISGRAQFRQIKVEKNTLNFGAVKSVVGTLSRSKDGEHIFAVLINKDIDNEIQVLIDIGKDFSPAGAEILAGSDPLATNLKTTRVGLEALEISKKPDGRYYLRLPACSVAGLTFKRTQ